MNHKPMRWLYFLSLLMYTSGLHSQTKINPQTQINWPNGYPFVINNYVAGQTPYTTIQAAVNAATATCSTSGSTCGSVTIPPSYTGTDQWTQSSTSPDVIVAVQDLRPLSNTNVGIKIVNAAQYGAKCNGEDDTAAINAALASDYAYNFPLMAHENIEVQLPAGSCVVSAPLHMGIHSSLVGQGASTYIVANYPGWVGTDYTVLEMQANGSLPAGSSRGALRISNFNIYGFGNSGIPGSTAISIINNANVYDSTNYTFENLSIDHMQINGFDTAILAEDLSNSVIDANTLSNLRVGINLFGQAVNVVIGHNTITEGIATNTSIGGGSVGINIGPNSKYGGGFEAPQGILIHDNNVVAYDDDISDTQCLSCQIHNNILDYAGNGKVRSGGAGINLGALAMSGGLWITDNFFGVALPSTYGIFSVTTSSGSSNGLWIENNYFSEYNTPSSTVGVVLNASSGAVQQAHINRNVFYNFTVGIELSQNLVDSEIVGNEGSAITGELINLSNASSLVHSGTVIESNTDTDSVPVVTIGSATGYRLGWNQSPLQFLGTQTASAAGCTFAAGTIGTKCSAAVTVTWPVAFHDTNYSAQCSLQSPTGGSTGIGIAGIVDGGHYSVNLVAQDTLSTGGGQVNCTATHN